MLNVRVQSVSYYVFLSESSCLKICHLHLGFLIGRKWIWFQEPSFILHPYFIFPSLSLLHSSSIFHISFPIPPSSFIHISYFLPYTLLHSSSIFHISSPTHPSSFILHKSFIFNSLPLHHPSSIFHTVSSPPSRFQNFYQSF